MNAELVRNVIFRIILDFVDGLSWSFAMMALITKFFGFIPKNRKKSTIHFCIVSAVYMIINVTAYTILTIMGKQIGIMNGFLILYILIYWMFHLQNVKKWKALIVGLIATQVDVVVLIVVSGIYGCLTESMEVPLVLRMILIILSPILSAGVCIGLSELSARKRKEPMSMALMVTTYISFFIIDMFLGIFEISSYTDVMPMIRLHVELEQGSGNFDFAAETVLVSSIVALMAIVIAAIMIIKESESEYFRKKNTISEYYLEVQKEHYEGLSESNREIRKIKHDMKNHVYVMRELYHAENYERLGEYLDQVGENLELADTSIHVGNEIADAILSEKSKKANELGIELRIDGSLPPMQMSALEICTIFANTLDNAIEAVDELPENQKKVELSLRSNDNFLYISEKNMTNGKVVVEDNQIMTSKKDKVNHGFGIINIKEAVEKYEGDVNIHIEDGEFHMEIMIPLH